MRRARPGPRRPESHGAPAWRSSRRLAGVCPPCDEGEREGAGRVSSSGKPPGSDRVRNEAGVREPHVIYYKELEAVQRRFSEWSFLVAAGDEKRMKKVLEGKDLRRTPTGAEIWIP